jgi:hypothetical protein
MLSEWNESMPLSPAVQRREIHHRTIDMRAYARDDGLYEVEARLIDTKPFPFERLGSPVPIPPGQHLHDLWIRLTVTEDFVVQSVEASSDTTPYGVCKEAEATLRVLVGERVVKGWSATVKSRLRGAASCTHLMEMLIPMGTTAFQGIRGVVPRQERIDATGAAPRQIDSCYAYRREGEVVMRLWPAHARRSD